jgi:hypothetical protein
MTYADKLVFDASTGQTLSVPLTKEEIKELDALHAQVAPSYRELRQAAYNERGATLDALIVALFEMTVEGRPEAAEHIQAIREQIKAEFPK